MKIKNHIIQKRLKRKIEEKNEKERKKEGKLKLTIFMGILVQ